MKPTERFSSRAAAYAQARPGYPDSAMDTVVAGLDAGLPRIAADIGAGTGISSRALAQRGFEVVAVEPNAPMRQEGRRPAQTRITWRDGTGERTGLDDASVSLVLCAQAFHWLDAPAALTEFRRILAPRGRAALVWNVHDLDDPATSAYRELVLRHATDPPTSPWFTQTACPLAAAPGWEKYRLLTFPNVQTLDKDGLVGRGMSASYMPASGAAGDAARADLERLFDAWSRDGVFAFRMVCEVHLAERESRL